MGKHVLDEFGDLEATRDALLKDLPEVELGCKVIKIYDIIRGMSVEGILGATWISKVPPVDVVGRGNQVLHLQHDNIVLPAMHTDDIPALLDWVLGGESHHGMKGDVV